MQTKPHLRLFAAALLVLLTATLHAQGDIKLELSGSGADRIRLATANFKSGTLDPKNDALRHTFDTVLYDDLHNAGIFDMVSKSMAPQATPGSPTEINLPQWSGAPVNASMVAFGALGVTGTRLAVNGFLFDVKNTQFPQVLAKQYGEEASEDAARQIAHRFADEIILRLSGGTNGIAETKIYFVHLDGGNKEIWEMDYDGSNQHPVTSLGSVSVSPRVSPDNTRLAFSSLGKDGFQIKMFSLLLNRMVSFPAGGGGTNVSPAWSSDGKQLAFSSSRTGDNEIYIADANGGSSRRITSFAGPDVSPVFNPRSGAQIAWISGRSGLPQLYTMETDGSGVTRLTDGGYATSPSWSPNGQFLAFAWNRKYGPGAPGGQDIYVMEIASKRWIQLTHDMGPCDFPSWSPDGRHIVFANSPNGRASSSKIFTMLADGTDRHALTGAGSDMPNWSWK
ncbi:PD40 domain-containing protein [Granulicella tundricola]|uniref:WD40-like beta Propeller containing protein n=1 Tax=Granulicella tundricola (strain ATCC BAA-1859 / DSM 23138 / MP5ACTX9) TaxID=1198114 RepID=E8WXM2_GRATM|nr:PD40 domain-containing protein [Granulicella tundricola]ADW68638.1 WD40-like beta Propeller containing protein [Granulicella tundricola MP5ACTX9]